MRTLKFNLPDIANILHDIPEGDMPERPEEFWRALALELGLLTEYAGGAEHPQIVLGDYRKAGTQYIWEFSVNDLATPPANQYNWHGQNTSQWKYAGAIVLQGGKVSRHH